MNLKLPAGMTWKSPVVVTGIAILALVIFFGGSSLMDSIGAHFTNAKIEKLEAEKKTSEDKILKLQGVIEDKNKDIADLSGKLDASNQTVIVTGKQTATARKQYDKVRATGPVFVDTEPTNKVSELNDILNTLYGN